MTKYTWLQLDCCWNRTRVYSSNKQDMAQCDMKKLWLFTYFFKKSLLIILCCVAGPREWHIVNQALIFKDPSPTAEHTITRQHYSSLFRGIWQHFRLPVDWCPSGRPERYSKATQIWSDSDIASWTHETCIAKVMQSSQQYLWALEE